MTYRADLLSCSIDPLSKKEQLALVVKGDKDTWLRSVYPLIIGAADKLHARKSTSQAPLDELISAGIVGALNAFDRFDVGQDVKVSTYAAWFIRGEQLRVLSHYVSVVSIPHANVPKAWDDAHPALLPAEDLDALEQLDASIGRVGGLDETSFAVDLAVRQLDPEEMIVICCLYGLCGYGKVDKKTTAKFLEITQTEVVRIRDRAKETLKEKLEGV